MNGCDLNLAYERTSNVGCYEFTPRPLPHNTTPPLPRPPTPLLHRFNHRHVSFNMSSRYEITRMADISAFLNKRQFPTSMKRRLRRYFKHFYSKKAIPIGVILVTELAGPLREEVARELVDEEIACVPMFKELPASSLVKLQSFLRPVRLRKGEVLVTMGPALSEMWVLTHGNLAYSIHDDNRINTGTVALPPTTLVPAQPPKKASSLRRRTKATATRRWKWGELASRQSAPLPATAAAAAAAAATATTAPTAAIQCTNGSTPIDGPIKEDDKEGGGGEGMKDGMEGQKRNGAENSSAGKLATVSSIFSFGKIKSKINDANGSSNNIESKQPRTLRSMKRRQRRGEGMLRPGETYGSLPALGMCRRHIATIWATQDCELLCLLGDNLLKEVVELLPPSSLEKMREMALQESAVLLRHCADRNLDFCDEQTAKFARALRLFGRSTSLKFKLKRSKSAKKKEEKRNSGSDSGEEDDSDHDDSVAPKKSGLGGRLGDRLKELDVKLEEVGSLLRDLYG